MFGYGSLINMDENHELADHSNRRVYPVKIKNLSREWCIHGTNQTFLGINEDKNSWCNGVLFCVSVEELILLDSREIYYTGKYIKKADITFYNPSESNILDEIDKIIYYQNDPKYEGKPEPLYPVSTEYINICLNGCEKISEEFKKDFIITTKGWDDAIKYSKLIDQ